MSSFDLNQASIEEEEHDLRVPNHGLLTTLYHRSSDYNCITFSQHGQQHGHKDQILFMAGSSCNDHSLIAAKKSHREDDLELSLCDPFSSFEREKEEEAEELGIRERNWMEPSKMRLMRKMMKYSTTHMIVSKPSSSQDEIQPDRGFPLKNIITRKNNNDNSILSSDIIRVCSDCNTTKTPLWRSGPCGPKSLCNACGIRQRKARRAMTTALNGVGLPNDGGGHATATMSMTNKIRKQKKLGIDRTDLPFKKRCKMNIGTAPPPPERIRFEDETLLASDEHNSSSTVLQKAVFLQEERDAAILLMDLSCGIIHS